MVKRRGGRWKNHTEFTEVDSAALEISAIIVCEPEARPEAKAPQAMRPKMPGHVRNDDAKNLGVTSNGLESGRRGNGGIKEG